MQPQQHVESLVQLLRVNRIDMANISQTLDKSIGEVVQFKHRMQAHLKENIPQQDIEISFRKASVQNYATNDTKQKTERMARREKAVMYFSDGLKYEGEVNNQKFDGFGIISKDGDDLYVGSFREGSFHGQGRLRNSEWINVETSLPFDDWTLYSGQFIGGLFDGMGTLVLSEQQKYLGRFREGNISGEGIYYRNQEIVLGKWVDSESPVRP